MLNPNDLPKLNICINTQIWHCTIRNKVYKLELVKNIVVNTKDKPKSQIYYCNYQTQNFSTSCLLSMKHLINKLKIATNLEIQLTKLIVTSLLGFIRMANLRAYVSYCQGFFLINQWFLHCQDFVKFRIEQIVEQTMVYRCTSQEYTDFSSKIPLPQL